MKIQGSIKHALLLTEKLYAEVDSRKDLQYLAGVNIQIAKGIITDSEMKSFLKALEGALSKFESTAPCMFEIESSVVSRDQVEIEESVDRELRKARDIEMSLAQGSKLITK